MKEYFKKILNIVFVKDEAIEYIEKDSKKIAKKTYKILKNICILITALIFAYTLIYVRLEGIVNAFENSKDLEKNNEEQHKKIYDTGKNKLVITKEKIYIYENWNLSKTLDIKEELNRRKFIRYGNL